MKSILLVEYSARSVVSSDDWKVRCEVFSIAETNSFERATQISSDMGQTKTLKILCYWEYKTKICMLLIANSVHFALLTSREFNVITFHYTTLCNKQ